MFQGCEVPLHFACKHGFAEVVAVLISHPKTDKFVRNKYHETPKEVRQHKVFSELNTSCSAQVCMSVKKKGNKKNFLYSLFDVLIKRKFLRQYKQFNIA